jgi:uncharacterized protein YggU (UPF0235/DUF167 family)
LTATVAADPRSPWRAAAGGVTVSLLVTPRARRNAVDGIAADADGGAVLKVAVTAAPEDGKANDAVITLLASSWHLPKGRFRVMRGAAARRKVLHVAGDPAALIGRMSAADGGR